MSIINAASQTEHDYQFAMFLDEHQKPVGTILDLVFNKWRSGKISEELGKHTIQMDVPVNWFQFYKGKPIAPMKVSAKVSVLAVVITIDGVAENHFLLDAETAKIEKFRTQVKFQGFKKGDEIPLTVISSEQELSEFVGKSNTTRLTVKSRLPRIISNKFYYPFSKPFADKIFNQTIKHSPYSNEISQEKFDEILSEVSQNDLFREGICNFWGRVVPIIVTDNEGDLIDLTLFAEKGDFDKVISLSDRYRENPSNSFRDILAWAYEEKSHQLSDKANQAKVDENDLFKKSLKHIQTSLELNPESISALEQKSRLLFTFKNYGESLKTIDFILTKKKGNIDSHLFRAFILIKLKEWGLALKEIKETEKLLKVFEGDNEYAKLIIKAYRAEILHGQGNYKKAWANILEVWENSPEEVIKHFGGSNFVDDIVREVPTIESIWFHIELLYFRATEFFQIHEFKTADDLADYAAILLNEIKLLDQIEEEPIVVGEVKESFVQNILERITKLLRDTGSKSFAEEQINKITDWFERIYKEEPVFLKNQKL
jgi:tetratricopeptide (TPR) repeat protein